MALSTPSDRDALSPAEAVELLQQGNQRFRDGHAAQRDLLEETRATSAGQWPFAAIVGCIDSRAPAELIFDCGIGDVFNARIAGNFANDDILGSLEFACKVAGAKAVVVLGHTGCGAVKGACDGVELGHLTGLLASLQPAVAAVEEPREAERRTSANAEFVDQVAHENVRLTVAALSQRSDVLRELATAGEITIVGAMYDVATGEVEFLGAASA